MHFQILLFFLLINFSYSRWIGEDNESLESEILSDILQELDDEKQNDPFAQGPLVSTILHPTTYYCLYQYGDRADGTYITIGSVPTENLCFQRCVVAMSTQDKQINSAVYNHNLKTCYCGIKVTSINTSRSFRSCILRKRLS